MNKTEDMHEPGIALTENKCGGKEKVKITGKIWTRSFHIIVFF
jgi:hypothetical protein